MLSAKAMPATWRVMCLVSSLVLSSGPLSAQVIAPQVIPRGTRIRVSLKGSQGNSVVGIADTLKDDWLRWWPTGRFADSLPLSALNTLEVSRGRHPNVLKGAVIGGTAGAVHGAFRGDKPNPTYRNFVSRCVKESGLEIIGWN